MLKIKNNRFLFSSLLMSLVIVAFTLFASVNTKKTYNKKSYSKKHISKYKPRKKKSRTKKVRFIAPSKDDKIIFNNLTKSFGIDISHYQKHINWEKVCEINNVAPISFVMMRATYGKNKKDAKFAYNWKEAGNQNFIRGAYHYYRPNEDSDVQANNFIANVKLEVGDFPPILDVEKMPRRRSMKHKKFEQNLLNWLTKIENHYGVKPIIYSSDSFIKNHLIDERFKEYTFWVANYNNVPQPKHSKWKFWQFTDKGKVYGIPTKVDVNIFNGNNNQLSELLIKERLQ
jgi:lysozyme